MNRPGRPNHLRVEQLAERVVRLEEEKLGRRVQKLSKADERRYGCDFRSTGSGGDEHLIEIKGWGEPLLTAMGAFLYTTELRTAQWEASKLSNWRLEIVANLTAAWENGDPPQRLTLTGADLEGRVAPMLWEVRLEGFQERIRDAERLAREGSMADGSDEGFWDANDLA